MHPLGLAVVLSLTLTQATPDSTAAWKRIGDDAQQLGTAAQHHDKAGLDKIVPVAKAHLDEFAAKYPKDPNAVTARMYSLQLNILMNQLEMPTAPLMKNTAEKYGEIVADATIPAQTRAEAAVRQTGLLLATAAKSKAAADWDAAEAEVDDFQKNFGDLPGADEAKGPVATMLRREEIGAEKSVADPARYEALLTKLAHDPHPDVVALVDQARSEQMALADLKSKPMDVKFTAVDGKSVDLADLRGKVVLIDFWATWCGPCRGETPNVVATYDKYHAQGFEIIGISLDQDKAALQAYVKQNKMPWPQYFDGLGWQNSISTRYGIQSIPAMWLVGKDGVLVTQDARDDLDGQVAKLLGTK